MIMQLPLFETIDTVKMQFRQELERGSHTDCPCCGRYAQIYRRKFHSSMAVQLIRLFAQGGASQFVHASNLIINNMAGIGDFTKAKYWGLIYPMEKPDDDAARKTSGYWRLTSHGEAFVRGAIAIPREVTVFDDRVLAMGRETTTIRQALADKFDYSELLHGDTL
jgi:hypothetical protein